MISPCLNIAYRLNLVAVCLLLAATLTGRAEPPEDAVNAQREIAAIIGGQTIYASAIDSQIRQLAPDLEAPSPRFQTLRRELLKKAIDRYLALEYLHRIQVAASEDDLKLGIIRLEKRLKLKQQTLDEYLEQKQLTRQELEHQLDWQITWNRYLNSLLIETNYQAVFNRNPAFFDGTQIKVSQILLKPEDNSPSQKERTLKQAQKITQQIQIGELTFAEAAKKHSISPNGKKGGLVGWIEYQGSMPPDFNQVAFQLKLNEISKPLISKFGIHIIRCDEIKQGTKSWQQARPQLRDAMIQELFAFLVSTQRTFLTDNHKLKTHIKIMAGWQ